MSPTATRPDTRRPGFRHEVRLYAGDAEFVGATIDFVRDGVRGGEAVLVAVAAHKIDLLRAVLGTEADRVQWVDMAEVGRNPSTIMPVWRDFVDVHAARGTPARGLGEPVWGQLHPAALVEFQNHEALLNLAFSDDPDFFLVCPYDTLALPPAVIDQALSRHPFADGRPDRVAAQYALEGCLNAAFTDPLPLPPTDGPRSLAFALQDLRRVRSFVRVEAEALGLPPERANDLVLAVNEAAANSIRHAFGHGTLRLWAEDGHVVCEVADAGRIRDPLVGRRRPEPTPTNSRGVWLINHLCDLVQIRSTHSGTVLRLHVALPGPG
ncbi:MAG TPA: sensor histidine kinase [Acidimicrobiales bacterium]